jgi:cytochrome c peroxidase
MLGGRARPPSERDVYQASLRQPLMLPRPRYPSMAALSLHDPEKSGVISCSSCHNPALGWEDALPRGRGHMGGRLARSTPTILNVAYGEPYFWDGRAARSKSRPRARSPRPPR